MLETNNSSLEEVDLAVELSHVDGGAVATHCLGQNEPSISNADGDAECWFDDGSLCYESTQASDVACDLDREWQRRREGFHTVGYRDGLMAGKEVSAQEGFNNGFKQSVSVGYKWGLVRGVTSALVCLPNSVIQKLVRTLETREKLQCLFEDLRSVSSHEALTEYYADVIASESKKQHDPSDRRLPDANMCKGASSNKMEMYAAEFESLKPGLGI